jgi:hypothetical protein
MEVSRETVVIIGWLVEAEFGEPTASVSYRERGELPFCFALWLGLPRAKLLDRAFTDRRRFGRCLDREFKHDRPDEPSPERGVRVVILGEPEVFVADQPGLELVEQVGLLADVGDRECVDGPAVEESDCGASARASVGAEALWFGGGRGRRRECRGRS